MARDIFNREVDLGQPIAADAARLLIPGLTDPGLLAQKVDISYEQAITRLYEVGSAKTYFVAGRPSGQISIARVLGGKGPSAEFLDKYGDVCKVSLSNRILLDFSAGCTSSQKVNHISAAGCVINSLAYSMATPDLIINEQVNMMIARLETISN